MEIFTLVSHYAMPLILFVISIILLVSNKNLGDSFFDGAKSGLESAIGLVPAITLIMCGVSAMFASGVCDFLGVLCAPVLSALGVPSELMPQIILRPFSSSAVTASADRMFYNYGPDSFISKTACLIMGSTDTIIYTIAVYTTGAKIKRTRYALTVSFIVFIFSVVVCSAVAKLML